MPSKATLERSLKQYQHSLQLKQSSSTRSANLVQLDQFLGSLHSDPSITTHNNDERYLTKEQLERVMQWKLARGKWRPRLQQLIESNDESLIQECTTFKYDNDNKDKDENEVIEEYMKRSCRLKGVGPATSSILLSIFLPNVQGFMSDEAIDHVESQTDDDDQENKKKKEYTVKSWREFETQLNERSKEEGWKSCWELERALWSFGIQSTLRDVSAAEEIEEKDENAKRKRETDEKKEEQDQNESTASSKKRKTSKKT